MLSVLKTSEGSENESEKGTPLSLEHLQEALEQRNTHVALNQTNARKACANVDSVNLEFKGIGSLDLARLLSNITHLYMSNNELRSTRGLEYLKILQLLDLSFNKIHNIDHLEHLENLNVLSLHANRISTLKEKVFLGMKKLTVLTLGNNLISDNKEILIFSHIENLGSLTLQNNPFCDMEYPSYVIAHVPNLAYLDYQRITEEEKKKAFELYSGSLAVVKMDNERRRLEMRSSMETKEEEKRHKMAGVYALNDDSLFNKLFEADPEMTALTNQPGVQLLIDRFREHFKGICMCLFEEGLLHAKLRNEEILLLEKALGEAKQASNEESRRQVIVLEENVKGLLEEAKELMEDEYESTTLEQEDYDKREQKILKLKEKIEETLDSSLSNLLENEVILVNQIKEVLEKAEEELRSMVSAFLSEASEHFEEGRRHAYIFYCRLRELTSKLVDSTLASSELNGSSRSSAQSRVRDQDFPLQEEEEEEEEEELPGKRNYTAEIFEGGDTLTAALARIHDTHLTVVNRREEEFRDHLTSWLKGTIDEFRRLEWRRHRTRLEEITALSQEKEREISELLPLEIFEEV